MMEVSDVHKQFGRFFAKQDLEGLGTLFHEDALFIPGPDREPIRGKKAILEEIGTYFGGSSEMKTESRVVHENGDIAMVRSQWVIHDGDKVVRGAALEVMRKVDGKWLYWIDSPYGI